jgi:cellulose synthase/poly-beta-1,6-N-acetylglucosamine synthase-like glycosyltransferase
MLTPWFAIAGFLTVAALLGYIFAGYPLLLGYLARRFAKPIQKRERYKTVSVLIAVHNGERFLTAKLDSVLALSYPKELLEILVLSDGSTDGTEEIARQYEPRGVKLLVLPKGGKPAALNAGIAQSHGEILVLTDVRQVLEPDSVAHLVACFADPSVGVVSGDLLMRRGDDPEQRGFPIYWRYERWIRKQQGKLDSMLGATGPFYSMRRELAVPMPADTLLDDMYLPLAAFFRGYRLIVDEDARALDYVPPLKAEFGRKVRTLAGNFQIMWQYPALWSFRNRMLFHFLSHKVARLALPYLFLLLLIFGFLLPGYWAWAAVWAQVSFYLLAAVDLLVPPSWHLKRLSSPARAFVLLVAAALFALAIFFVPPQKLWKPTQLRDAESGTGR